MTNLEKYNKVFKEVFEVEETALGEEFTTKNIEKWDSISQMALVTELEQNFDILIDIDDIYELDSYMSGIEVLKKYNIEI